MPELVLLFDAQIRNGGDFMEKAVHKVKVTFTQQQMELLDKLKREGTFGEDYPDIILAVFHEYLEQEFGKEGVK